MGLEAPKAFRALSDRNTLEITILLIISENDAWKASSISLFCILTTSPVGNSRTMMESVAAKGTPPIDTLDKQTGS
jgi:hypothetical protein